VLILRHIQIILILMLITTLTYTLNIIEIPSNINIRRQTKHIGLSAHRANNIPIKTDFLEGDIPIKVMYLDKNYGSGGIDLLKKGLTESSVLLDKDQNLIHDRIDQTLREIYVNGSLQKPLKIEVLCWDQQSLQEAISIFRTMGGKILKVWEFINGFLGIIPASNIEPFARQAQGKVGLIEPAWGYEIVSYSDWAPILTGVRSYVWDTLGLKGDPNATICVLDTGVDTDHPMLARYEDAASNSSVWSDLNVKVVGWYEPTGTYTSPTDVGGHGTHVSSIAAGRFYSGDPDNDSDYDITDSLDITGYGPVERGTYYVRNSFRINSTGAVYVSWEAGQYLNTTLGFSIYYPNGTLAFRGTTTTGSGSFYVDENSVNKAFEYRFYFDTYSVIIGIFIFYYLDLQYFVHFEVPIPSQTSGGYPLFSGVAPDTKLVVVDIFEGSVSDIVTAIEWVWQNAETYHILVETNSWGITDSNGNPIRDASIDNAIRALIAKGIVVTVAAGNDGTDVQGQTLGSPAEVDEVITVAASDFYGPQRTSYSSVGPGTANTTKPDVMAPGGTYDMEYGGSYVAADTNDAEDYGTEFTNSLIPMSGTSMATPHVAGICALMAQAIGGYTAWITNSSNLDWLNEIGAYGYTDNDETSGYPYWTNYSYNNIIKRYLLATAWETNHTASYDGNGFDDAWEGWGFAQARAAIEALLYAYNLGTIVGFSLYGGNEDRFKPHVWARRVYLEASKTYRFKLDVPSGADFDLILFAPYGDTYGEPVVAAYSTTHTIGADEEIMYTPTVSGWYLITVKQWSGNGQFKFVAFEETTLGKYQTKIHSKSGSSYGFYVDTTETGIFLRIYHATITGDLACGAVDYATLSYLDSENNNPAGQLDYLVYNPGSSLGAIGLVFNSTGSVGGYTVNILPIRGSIDPTGTASSSLSGSGYAFVMILNNVVGNGQYRVRVSPDTSLDVGFEVLKPDGETIYNVSNVGVGGEESVSFTAPIGGTYYIIVYSVSGSGTVTVYYEDIGTPSITITNPQNNYNTSSTTVTIYWSSSDIETSIVEHEIWVDGSLQYDAISGTATQYDITLSEGTHAVEVRAYDQCGNWAGDTITITVDITAPTVTITSPSNGSYIASSDVTVSWTGDDTLSGINHYEVRIKNSTWDSGWINKGTTTGHTFTSLADGAYTIFVKAVDNAGNIATTSIEITVDTTSPSVTISSPSNYSWHNSRDISVSWSATDNLDLRDYQFYVNGSSTGYPGGLLDGTSYSTTITVTVPDDGGWEIKIVVSDKAGNTDSVIVYVYSDIVPPSVTITDPQNDSVVSTTFYVYWDSSDNFVVDRVDVFLNGTLNQTYDYDSSNVCGSHRFSGLRPDTWYNVTVVAYDNAGNRDRSYVVVLVKELNVTITSPKIDQTFNVTDVALEWSYDGAPENFTIYLDGEYVDVVYPPTMSYTLINLGEGRHNATVVAMDVGGNTVKDYVLFYVDLTSPSVNIVFPAEDDWLNTRDVTVSWNSNDALSGIAYHLVRIDGGSWNNVSTDTSYVFTNVGDGQHVVEVKAFDNAGNAATATVSFYVDAASPSVSLLSPADNEYFAGTRISVGWDMSDNLGIRLVEVIVDGSVVWSGNAFSYMLTLGEGQHNITVRVYDNADNTASSSVIMYVDLTAPSLTVDYPRIGVESDAFTISWAATDNFGVAYYEYRVDGGGWIITTQSSVTLDLAEGEHIVYVRAYDFAGNFVSSAVGVIVDRTKPTLLGFSPSNNTVWSSKKLTISISVSDNLGVHEIRYSIDGGAWRSNGVSTTLNLSLFEGKHTIDFEVYDLAGNVLSFSLIYRIDLTPPDISIISPSDLEEISSSDVTVRWQSSSTDIAYYLVRLDDNSWINVGTATSHTFSGVPDGLHVVYVVAVDYAGHKTMSSVVFRVSAVSGSAISTNLKSKSHETLISRGGEQPLSQNLVRDNTTKDVDTKNLGSNDVSEVNESVYVNVPPRIEKSATILIIIPLLPAIIEIITVFMLTFIPVFPIELRRRLFFSFNTMVIVFSPYILRPPKT